MRPLPARFAVPRARRAGLAVFGGYLLLAFLVVGLPALVRGGNRYIGFAYDPEVFMWAFAWWPHAILHGQNPFFTTEIWSPYGVNTMWSTTVPGLALVFAPLTLLAGPILSYDVAAVIMPALSAWTAFCLCRYLTGRLWPSIAGGYFFGFSSYMLIEDAVGGHLNLAAVFLLPVVALLVLRYLDGVLDARGLIVRLGPVFAAQVVISTEVLFTVTLALAVSLPLGYALYSARRSRLVALLAPLAGSYAVAAALTAPFLWYAVSGIGHGRFYQPDFLVANLGNFVVPSSITAAGGSLFTSFSRHFGGANPYLGLPALVLVGLFLRERWRSPLARFVLVAIAVSVIAALGSKATLGGTKLITMPWRLVQDLPVFDNVLTGRLVVFTFLVVAVVIAMWTASRAPGPLQRLLPALAILAIFPNPAAGNFSTAYSVPAFFTRSVYRSCLDPGETVLPLPIRGGSALLWQIESGFRFKMAGGDIGPDIPQPFVTPETSPVTGGGSLGVDQAGDARNFIAAMHVSSVVVDEKRANEWAGALDQIAAPHALGGVVLYQLAPNPPTCAGA